MKQLIVLLLLALLFSCKKETSKASKADLQKSKDFQTILTANRFVAAEYYSLTPIDYVTNDAEIKSETDLWKYVPNWVRTDTLTFDNDAVHFQQGLYKWDQDNSPVISRPYNVGADNKGVYLNFVSHEYIPLTYRVESFDNTGFVILATWQGKTVYSKFKIL